MQEFQIHFALCRESLFQISYKIELTVASCFLVISRNDEGLVPYIQVFNQRLFIFKGYEVTCRIMFGLMSGQNFVLLGSMAGELYMGY